MASESTPTMTFGSLFAGIGGFDLGLERAGMECLWQVEINEFCREILMRHWPDVPKYEDVRDVGASNLAPVDVICGGFPCQDISTAGRTHKGISQGKKSGLWSEFARIIRELEPSYVFIENVSALRYSYGGLGIVLRDLAEAGYDAEWTVLRASDVGAPHRRARLWLVAYPNSSSQSNGSFDAETRFLPQPDEIERRWSDPPEHLQVDDGIPYRVGNAAYGNAIVPRIAEEIGRRLLNG